MAQENERKERQARARVGPIGETEYAQIVLTTQQARAGESPEQAALRGAEDVALIGIMYDCLLRPSEVLAVRWRDLEQQEDGSGCLVITPSRVCGTATLGYVSARTLSALLEWRSGIETLGAGAVVGAGDRVFPLDGRMVSKRIQDACRVAGLEGKYGGDSPRIGMVRELALAGFSLVQIAQAGRWSSPSAPLRYMQ